MSPSSPIEHSGRAWTHKFPTSKLVKDLDAGFRPKVTRFLDALTDADVDVTVTATRRPRQRAYLMHFAWCIVKQCVTPDKVPAFVPASSSESGVPIQWLHCDAAGKPSARLSMAAAQEMVSAFSIGGLHVPPSLRSLHIAGQAIDMVLRWDGDLVITDGNGKESTITSTPRSGVNADLIKVGATFGVHHLVHAQKDPPHWSINGH
jgi:hypothetical protein